MLEQFSATIDKLYAAAADASRWEEALRAIESYTGSTGAVLNLVPKTATAAPMVLAGSFSRDDCAEYAADYMWRCPRIAFAKEHPEIPVHWDQLILTEREMDRDATYEWYGSHGLRYYVAGWIGESSSHRAYMSLQRSRRQGHVEPEQVDQFKLVLKHMSQALTLAVKLGTLDQQFSFHLALIDRLPHAIFALDGERRVLLTNAQADRLLGDGDAVVMSEGKLQCRLSAEHAAFEQAVSAALEPEEMESRGGWTRIHRSSGRRPLVVLVAPLAPSGDMFGAFQPRALVIVTDPSESAIVDEEALHDLFGLSVAEARLAGALSGGHSIESAAALLGIQQATARSELKSVFRKVGVNRQQDLVRLLTSLSSLGYPSNKSE